jgi:hypothetical protein
MFGLTIFGGIGHQLDVVDDDFDTEAQALLTLLNLWNVDYHPDRTKACKFRIKVAFGPDHKDIGQLWTSMEELKTGNLPNIASLSCLLSQQWSTCNRVGHDTFTKGY